MKKLLLIIGSGLSLSAFAATTQCNNPQVELDTNMGKIVLKLDAKKAPITVQNFTQYVQSGFYTNKIFHRVIPGFMIQGGGFDEKMTQAPTKSPITNEANNGLLNQKYTIAMARTNDPNSATAQFFINVKDNDFLNYSANNPGYAVFGQVTSGTAVVDKIAGVATTTQGMYSDVPVKPVIIKKAKMLACAK